jgi:photosystem II stability/assembly factor-like uncharacterized protein
MHRALVLLLLFFATASSQTFRYVKNPMGVVHSSAANVQGTLYVGASTVYASSDQGTNWTRIGLSTLGGANVHVMSFTKDGKLIACVDQGGIRILQPGNVWKQFNTGLPKNPGTNQLPNIRAFTRDSAGHFFAGSRSGNLAPLGMFFAQDTGSAWIDISSGLPSLEIAALSTSPSGIVYCAPEGYGIYKYSGTTWTPVNSNLADLRVQTIVFDGSGALFAGTSAGVSVLKNNAASWINYSVENGKTPVLSLAVDPSQGGRMFAGLGYSQYQSGPLYGKIYASNDSGKTWNDVSPAVKTLRVKTISVTSNGTVYAGAQGMFRSTDHGATWTVINNGLKEAVPALTGGGFTVTKNGHFLEGSEYGIWRSADNGETWTESNNGLKHPMIEFLFRDSLGYLFACAHALPRHESTVNRLYRSTDDGYTWDTVKVSLDGIYSMIAQGFNNELYLAHGFGSQPPSATLIGSSLAKSTDRGATWVDLPCYGGKGFSVGVTKRGTILFGGETLGLFRSTDKGASWDTTIHVGPGGNMAPIVVSPRGEIFTCSYGDNHIWFSDSVTDGKSYTNMVHPSFPMYVTANAFQWSSTGRMYVGLKGNPPNTGMYYVDGPITANSVFTPVPNLYFNVTKMHWDDEGYMWIYGSGSLAKSDSVLTAPKKTTGVKGSNSVPSEFALHQNYPNPFNPGTAIGFTLHVSGITTLKVYDALGREISTLVNEHLETGVYHERMFDASHLASGFYFARLTSGGSSQMKKMILLK